MTSHFTTRFFAALAIVFLALMGDGCSAEVRSPANAQQMPASNKPENAARGGGVREPAVAGLFYPAEEAALTRMLDSLLAAARPEPIPDLKGLVCPHAGYQYSGLTAAFGYKGLAGRQVDTVIILGASHYAGYAGACIPRTEAYRTPLGLAPISEKAARLAAVKPFFLEKACPLQRPSWWRQSSKSAPPAGEDTPETWEHSIEVQIPFLQRVLKGFKILPILLGEVDPEQVAQGLAGLVDDRTVIVASSDLSHYHPYEEAKALDQRCVAAICGSDLRAVGGQEACGKLPILVLLHLAQGRGWKPRLLDYRNSGDTAGNKEGVVGYAAVGFSAGGASARAAQEAYSAADRKFLLDLARKAVSAAVRKENAPALDPAKLERKFTESKACFVTLKKKGALRGCIGHIVAREPLYQALLENARSAAVRDYRFEPVESAELSELDIEVSVLTDPQPLEFSSPEDLLKKLQPGRDGVVLQIGERMATYLPQVWEQIPQKEAFLSHLAQKAGAGAADWRKAGAKVSVYQVESFAEAER